MRGRSIFHERILDNEKALIDDDTNPSLANVPILYPLKRTEKLWSSGFFRIYEMET